MTESVYRKLQETLDTYSVGFPATKSGIEIDILKYLFTEKDANMFLALSPKLETAAEISERLSKPIDSVFEELTDMAERGLIFRLKKGDIARFGAIPFVHGIFEFQVKSIDRPLAELCGKYFEEAFDDAMLEGVEYFLRTIPVNQAVDVSHNVASYEDAIKILKEKDKIVVTDCICRKRTNILDEGCGKPLEVCFMFGSMGQYYLDRKIGRVVSLSEASEILKKCNEAGLVTQPATAQNPAGMCNCCGDCCGVLAALRKHPAPATKVFSNYSATVDQEACIGCGVCPGRCQVDAIRMTEDDTAQIEKERCIGCGLCVTACPENAIRLIQKPEEDRRTPPSNSMEQMIMMAQKRGLI